MKKIGKFDALKALGIVAAGLSLGVSLLTNHIEDKKMDAKIAEKVNLAITQLTARED